MTNADRIRTMTDEELAKFVLHVLANGISLGAKGDVPIFDGNTRPLEWLQMEADDEHT